MTQCPLCSATLAPGATLDPGCTGATIVRLYDAPRVLRELQITITGQASRPDATSGYPSCATAGCTHGPDEPGCVQGVVLGFHAGAARAAEVLRELLRRYAGAWGRTTRISAEQAPQVARLMSSDIGRAALLAATNLGSRGWAPDLARELRVALEDGWARVDRPPSTAFVGWCPCPGGRALYAREDTGIAVCPACGDRVDATAGRTALLARLPGIGAQLMTKPQLAVLCGLPIGTLHRWSSEGRIVCGAVNGKGQPMYPAGPVIDAALRGVPPARPARTAS